MPGEKAMKDMRPMCVQVTATLESVPPKVRLYDGKNCLYYYTMLLFIYFKLCTKLGKK
jgi:hypothetical protein